MIDHLLTDECDVYSTSNGTDSMGGVTGTRQSPARLPSESTHRRQLTETEQSILGREGLRATHRFYFAGGTTIKGTDRIVYDSKSHDVVRVDDPHNLGEFLQVDAILRR